MRSLAGWIDKLMWAAGLILLCLTAAALGRQLALKVVGCYIDNQNFVRDMKGLMNFGLTSYGGAAVSQGSGTEQGPITSNKMTHELCSGVCALGGFRYMALQATNWCTCDNSKGSQGEAGLGECSATTCSGNGSQVCGALDRNYVLELSYAYAKNLFVLGNRTLVGINNPSVPAYTTLTARSHVECADKCDSASSCQAVIFNQQQRLCHLLELAAVPSALGGSGSGDFFVRG